ncbi:protein of unknown function [Latilactobacillus sakei]|nr:protein of unknown function [Latilactobacillus sakei]SON72082.1 protein of unknown function [Latilactobacillus sakei]
MLSGFINRATYTATLRGFYDKIEGSFAALEASGGAVLVETCH